MVSEIRIYVEGGGGYKNTKIQLRKGFSNFLKDLVQIARSKRIRWNVIICGSRGQAFSDFTTALKTHPNTFNVLLVDSEGPVHNKPWKHLQERDSSWDIPNIDDEHCHLMVQIMEAWFIADIEALSRYYGQGFRENFIPGNPKVEEIDKERLLSALKEAARDTSKGEYQKIRHASELLARIDSSKVRKAAPHCDRLFTTLAQRMN